MIKLSIIVPVYNDEKYLVRNVESLILQPIEDMEIIYVLDGCTDNSEKIVLKYQQLDDRIKVIKQPNRGQGAARNKGLDIATGKFILFVDSDDYLESECLNQMVDIAEQDNLDLLQGFFRFVDETGNEIKNWCEDAKQQDKIYTGIDLLKENKASCTVCLCLISHELIKAHGMRFVEGLLHEDVDFFSRMFYYAKRVKIYYNAYYNRTIRAGSTMTSHNLKKYSDLCQIAKVVTQFVECEVDENAKKEFFDDWIVFLYSSIVHNYICKGDSLQNLFEIQNLRRDVLSGLKKSQKVRYKIQYYMLKFKMYRLYEILYFKRAKYKVEQAIQK